MKKFLVLVLSLIALTTFAAVGPVPNTGFGIGSTNSATTLSWAIISANSVNGGAPAITYMNVGSGSNTSGVIFYKIDAVTTCNLTNATVNIPVTTTNGFATNAQVIVIQHLRNDTYERCVTDAGSVATNLVVTVAPSATLPGDVIYKCTQSGWLPIGITTNSFGSGGGPIYVGQQGKPLLLEIGAHTASACINLVGGYYLPKQ